MRGDTSLNVVPMNKKFFTLEKGEPYTFVVVSDIHITDTDTRLFEQLNASLVPSDAFVAVTGDIADSGSRTQLTSFKDIASVMNVPCFAVIGNHDIFFNRWPIWNELIGGTVYRRDAGDTTLLFTDTANGTFGVRQLEWLETQLKTARRHIFVFTHFNFFVNSITDIQQFTDIRERNRVLAMLDGKADVMFAGHSHQKSAHKAGSVWYVTNEDFWHHKTFIRVSVSSAGVEYWYERLP